MSNPIRQSSHPRLETENNSEDWSCSNADFDSDTIQNDSESIDSTDSFGDRSQNITRNQVLKLLHKVQNEHPTQEKELLEILREALRDISYHENDAALEAYQEVSDTLASSSEPDTNNSEAPLKKESEKIQSRIDNLKSKHIISEEKARELSNKLQRLQDNHSEIDAQNILEELNQQLDQYPVDSTTGEMLFSSEGPLGNLSPLIDLIVPKPSASEVLQKIQTVFPELNVSSLDKLQELTNAKLFPPTTPNAKVVDLLKALDPDLKQKTDKLSTLGARGYITGYFTNVNDPNKNWHAKGDATFLVAQSEALDRLTILLNGLYSGKGNFTLLNPTHINPQARNVITYTPSEGQTINFAAFHVEGFWGLSGDCDNPIFYNKQFQNPRAGESAMSPPSTTSLNRENINIGKFIL